MTCAAGHLIDAAFAFHGSNEHFLWGHQCPTDGLYWATCPSCGGLASATDWKGAALALGGTWR